MERKKIMTVEENKTNCPEVEFVSAFFDGELDPATAEYKHIKDCPECKKHLDSYQELADSIKGEFDIVVPNGLAERIIAGVKRRNQLEAQPETMPFPLLIKMAAMFILIFGVLYVVIPKAPPKPSKVEDLEPKPQFLNDAVPMGNLTTMDVPSRDRIANNTGSIDLEHFFPSSTRTDHKINFVANDGKEKPAWIPTSVKQVWVVKDVSTGLNKMAKLANEKNILSMGKNSQGDGELNLKLSKVQLVNLVRQCHKAGFKLLSPTQPQPEQNTFAGNQNDEVTYKAVLTQK